MDKEGGLAIARIGEFFFWAIKADRTESILEKVVCLVIELADGGISLGHILTHADVLGSLAGKDQCDTHKEAM